jgi:hypothetical protein
VLNRYGRKWAPKWLPARYVAAIKSQIIGKERFFSGEPMMRNRNTAVTRKPPKKPPNRNRIVVIGLCSRTGIWLLVSPTPLVLSVEG